ncbi:hypothetical protein [Kribbella sp. NPDC023855]|uniref:hypothetical protein n=1 Tax=Kribbella sp. NPDC023855 TaxID=3154698 RepID=UPI0033EEBA9F
MVVAPLTFNTLNAWAHGLAGTYPITTLCAALGARTPSVAVPFANHDLAGHPAWPGSLAVLRGAGVKVVDPQDGSTSTLEPVASGTGYRVSEAFEWEWVLRQFV